MDTKTICQVGCLMSSTAMGLAGADIPIQDLTNVNISSTPKSLNEWLKMNEGYDGSNDLIETQVPLINPARIEWNDADAFHKYNDLSFDEGDVITANAVVIPSSNNIFLFCNSGIVPGSWSSSNRQCEQRWSQITTLSQSTIPDTTETLTRTLQMLSDTESST